MLPISRSIDDNDLDDEALWAVIDSTAAASASSTTRSHRLLPLHNRPSPKFTLPVSSPRPLNTKSPKNHHFMPDREVLQEENFGNQRPQKLARFCLTESPPLAVTKHVQRRPTTPSSYLSHSSMGSPPDCSVTTHSLSGRFPTVALFKEYQNAAMSILEKSDYTMISGNPFIKKSGWRKISFYFNVSFEIKDKCIEFDENRNVQRAEFVVRAHMQGGRFCDGWGSCERHEKRFIKPNHDIPGTAETRAKNKACQDLLGIGEYHPGVNSQRL